MREWPHYRTLWISDAHLGSRGSRAHELARFLAAVRCSKLYLTGDLFDLWHLKRRWFWPPAHSAVVRQILAHARWGTRVIFIPGNHDEGIRELPGIELGGVELRHDDVHRTADGRRLFITHGDQYDPKTTLTVWVGAIGYPVLSYLHHLFNAVRRLFGYGIWPLAARVKNRMYRLSSYIGRYQARLREEARRRGCDGVVCGHVHQAAAHEGEVAYYNCGDWVESCQALVEHHDGRMEIVDGVDLLARLPVHPDAEPADDGPFELPMAV